MRVRKPSATQAVVSRSVVVVDDGSIRLMYQPNRFTRSTQRFNVSSRLCACVGLVRRLSTNDHPFSRTRYRVTPAVGLLAYNNRIVPVIPLSPTKPATYRRQPVTVCISSQ